VVRLSLKCQCIYYYVGAYLGKSQQINPDIENVFKSRYVYSLSTWLAADVTKVVRANQLCGEHISGSVTDPVML
jgi:hypothetical protein